MKTISLLIVLMFSSFGLLAQDSDTKPRTVDEYIESLSTEEENIEEFKKYRELGGLGIGVISFRDFSTSPLIYRGTALGFKTSTTKISSKKEIKFGIDANIGLAFSKVREESSLGLVSNWDVSYTRLYPIGLFSSKGWQSKVGGSASIFIDVRANPDLANNAIGFEFFPTLFGSYKIGKDFTRHLPLRKKKGPRDQHFSFQLDVGLINSNYRNGYAYTIHAPFYNSTDYFGNHQFHFFSGFRVRTVMDYILYSKSNDNAIKVSYNWSAVLSGKFPDRFTMSSGLLSFSYLYRLN